MRISEPPSHVSLRRAFPANSVIELVPLARRDGRPVGAGASGEHTCRLQPAYHDAVARAWGKPV